ncbi:30S ribosomal protein S17 [Sesbania bispinosa]|nr:30S ribosomal protein S17 [Sesbania bispinosa]
MEERIIINNDVLEKVLNVKTEDTLDAPVWDAKIGRSRKINQTLFKAEDLSNLTEIGMLKLPRSLFDS